MVRVVCLVLLSLLCAVHAANDAPNNGAGAGTVKVSTVEELMESMDDPQLRDIFHSVREQLRGLSDRPQMEKSFKQIVKSMKKRIADSFAKVRVAMFLDPPEKHESEGSAHKGPTGGGNSSELLNRPRPVVADHLGAMDSQFKTWIPSIKRDIEMAALIMTKLAADYGASSIGIAQRAAAELRRIPVKYGRLRRKLQAAFSKTSHEEHAELHKGRVIQSECGKPYTLEEFVEVFDHDHNLHLTEEPTWTDQFREEFYTGWPVWANEMRLVDPACGSRIWSLPPKKTAKDEL